MANSIENMAIPQASANTADRWAIGLSVICMVHCLGTPFILTLSPLLQVSATNELLFHGVLLLPLLGFALWAFWRGYKLHQKKVSIVLGCIGFGLLFLGLVLHEYFAHWELIASHAHSHATDTAFLTSWGSISTLVGSIFLIAAHAYNMKFCDCACHNRK